MAVFLSKSGREGPLTAVYAQRMKRCRFPAGDLVTRTAAVPDQELVRDGQQGDLQAFDELMRRHGPQAYHAALAVLHDHQDAQDTVQGAFLAGELSEPRRSA